LLTSLEINKINQQTCGVLYWIGIDRICSCHTCSFGSRSVTGYLRVVGYNRVERVRYGGPAIYRRSPTPRWSNWYDEMLGYTSSYSSLSRQDRLQILGRIYSRLRSFPDIMIDSSTKTCNYYFNLIRMWQINYTPSTIIDDISNPYNAFSYRIFLLIATDNNMFRVFWL